MTGEAVGSGQETESQRPWVLTAVCLGLMMAGFSGNMVNLALPSIGSDLHMSDAHLTQITSAYVATFGGAMLMAGRLGDAFGHQRMFALGVGLFAIASLGCGVAASAGMLLAWRSAQGIGGAIVCVLALCLAENLFVQQAHRTKALGLCSLISAVGASAGVVIGGALVSALDWRWVFFVNVPIGVGCALGLALLPATHRVSRKRLDTRGAVLAIVLLVAVAGTLGNESLMTGRITWPLAAGIAAAVLLVTWLWWSRPGAQSTMARQGRARMGRVVGVNVVAALMAIALLTWGFACSVYLQRVLGFTAMQVGLLFLPDVLVSAGAAFSLAPRLVARFGVRLTAVTGLLCTAAGLMLLWQIPSDALFLYDILPGMLLVGLGSGLSYSPLVHAALRLAEPERVGAASGLINTSYMLGGALGLSALGSIAAGRTADLIAAGVDGTTALSNGYRLAFALSAAVAFAGAIMGAAVLRDQAEEAH